MSTPGITGQFVASGVKSATGYSFTVPQSQEENKASEVEQWPATMRALATCCGQARSASDAYLTAEIEKWNAAHPVANKGSKKRSAKSQKVGGQAKAQSEKKAKAAN
jgi:hypothetical protein